MGVINMLKGFVSKEEKTYQYQCKDCDHEFESTERKLKNAECPECGSNFVQDAVI